MKEFVHIVFGDSAAGTLRYFFKKNQNEYEGDVINFREEYSVGPLYEIDTEAGHRKRIKWVEKLLNEVVNVIILRMIGAILVNPKRI